MRYSPVGIQQLDEAKWAAKITLHFKEKAEEALAMPLLPEPPLQEDPSYTWNKRAWFPKETGKYIKGRWWKLFDGRLAIPGMLSFVKQIHQGIHMGETALEMLLKCHFYMPRLSAITRAICELCLTCTQNKPWQGPTQPPGIQEIGAMPCENLLIVFTELSHARGCWYMLVLICTFPGWVDAFLTRTEKAREVTKVLLRDIIPRFELPVTRIRQWAGICSWYNASFNKTVKNKVEVTYSLSATKFRKSRTHEPDTQATTEEILPRNSSEMESGLAYSHLPSQGHTHQANWVFTLWDFVRLASPKS